MTLLDTTKSAYAAVNDKAWFIKTALKMYNQNPIMFKEQISFLESMKSNT